MEKLVLDEHDLSARWGMNVKTLKRWRNDGHGPRYIKIGRSVTYLPKDIEHFEPHGGADIQTLSKQMGNSALMIKRHDSKLTATMAATMAADRLA